MNEGTVPEQNRAAHGTSKDGRDREQLTAEKRGPLEILLADDAGNARHHRFGSKGVKIDCQPAGVSSQDVGGDRRGRDYHAEHEYITPQ
jgi:hypothetical protein